METEPAEEMLLLDLPIDALRLVLSLCGPRAAASAASTCSTLARLHAELVEARGPFAASSALVELPEEGGGGAEAAAATSLALDRLSGVCVHAAVVLFAFHDQRGAPALLQAVLERLPRGVKAMLVSGVSVAGPSAAGAVETESGMVVLLLACPSGVTPRLSAANSPYPRSVEDARVWLAGGVPVAHNEQLLWSALFWGKERVRMGETPPPIRAYPRAAWVGGVASGGRGPGIVLTGERGAESQLVSAAALSLYQETDARAPRLRVAAGATRGLRRLSPCAFTITHIEQLTGEGSSVPFLIVPSEQPVELSAGETSWLTAHHGGAALPTARKLEVELYTAAQRQLGTYLKVWVAAEDDVAATAASMAAALELDVSIDDDMDTCVYVDPAQFDTPSLRAALAARRLRCAAFVISEDTAEVEFSAAAGQLAGGLAGGAAVLAAACSGRGDGLYRTHPAMEAHALEAAFPGAWASVVVNGELGAPAGLGVGGQPACLQTFTTTLASVGGER